MISHSPSSSRELGQNSVGLGSNAGTVGSPPGGAKEAGRQQVIRQYFLGETLGKSLFGVVFQGLNSDNGEFVAIKQIPLEELDPQKVANITKEIENFKGLDHPYIVRVFDAIPTDKYLYLVLELVEGGSILVMKESFVNLPESLLAKYISKCLKGLAYLHRKKIVHSDIKGVNVLITREGQVKLADCIQTKLKGTSDAMAIGQPFWMAPEVIKNNNETPASDVWSLGCTIIELFTGTPPYSHLASMAAVLQIMKDEHPPIPEGISAEFKDFLLRCLQKEPSKRATVEELLEMPWIKNARSDDDGPESLTPPLSPSESTTEERPLVVKPHSEIQDADPGQDEEHLTLKVHLSDLHDIKNIPIPSVMLFVFQDTHAAAMVDVALRKAGVGADSTQYCLVEIDNVTGEERRFNDFDLPKLEAEVLWQFEGEIRFSIKKKGAWVREGPLNRLVKKKYQTFYYVLDFAERYLAGYVSKPANRDEEVAAHVVYGFHLIKWVYISDEIENGFVIRYQNGKEDVFRTETYEDMISWVNEIRYACDIHFLFDEED